MKPEIYHFCRDSQPSCLCNRCRHDTTNVTCCLTRTKTDGCPVTVCPDFEPSNFYAVNERDEAPARRLRKRDRFALLKNVLLGGAAGFIIGALVTKQIFPLILSIAETVLVICLNIAEILRRDE